MFLLFFFSWTTQNSELLHLRQALYECVNLSSAEARKIHNKSGLTWTCQSCLQLGSGLNDLKRVIVQLQDEIKILKSQVSANDTRNICNTTQLMESEKIIQEITERNKRENNLIIFNIKEANRSSKQDQINADTVYVNDLMSQLVINGPISTPVRIGKFGPSNDLQCRPIRIRLNSTNDVLTAIKNFKKVKSVDQFAQVNMSRDRTPMQMKIFKSVKDELKRRIDSGDKDLKIMYRSGIPTIVPSLN